MHDQLYDLTVLSRTLSGMSVECYRNNNHRLGDVGQHMITDNVISEVPLGLVGSEALAHQQTQIVEPMLL